MPNFFLSLKEKKKTFERVKSRHINSMPTNCSCLLWISTAQSCLLSSLCSHIFSTSSDTDPCLALKFCNLFLKVMYRTVSLNMFFSPSVCKTGTGESLHTRKKKTKQSPEIASPRSTWDRCP